MSGSSWNYPDRQGSQPAAQSAAPTDPRYAAYYAQQQQQQQQQHHHQQHQHQQQQPTGRYGQSANSYSSSYETGAQGESQAGTASGGYGQYYGGNADSSAFQTGETSSPAARAIEGERSFHDSPASPAPRNVSRPPAGTSAPAQAAAPVSSYDSHGHFSNYYNDHAAYTQQQQHHQQQQQQHAQAAQHWPQHGQRSVSGSSAPGNAVFSSTTGAGAYQTLSAGNSSGTPTLPASAPAHQASAGPSSAPTSAHPHAFSGYNHPGYTAQQQQQQQQHAAYYYAQQQHQQQQQQQQHQQQAPHSAYYNQHGYGQQGISPTWMNHQWASDPRYANAAAASSTTTPTSAATGYGQPHSGYPNSNAAQYQFYANQQQQQQQAQLQHQAAAQAQAQAAIPGNLAQSQAGYAGLGKRPAEEPVQGGKTKKTKAGKEPIIPEPSPPAPSKSELKPPKQPGSAWQFFFTDQLNAAKAQASSGYKLNVAEVAKDAGAAYNELAAAEKDVYIKRAANARDGYKKEYAAWLVTLSPDEIKRENEFRAGQRKSGKSRKGNLKDPNAPKKPLSAYFLFLKAIRSNKSLTKLVFEDASATTMQSTLAALRWRNFTPEQKGPFLRQSEADKAEYEQVRKQYDADTQARSRGEEVPERPKPVYARDLVSPRLLCAVLPDGPEEDLEAVRKDAAEVYRAPTKASRAEAGLHVHDDEAEQGLAQTPSDDQIPATPVGAGFGESDGAIPEPSNESQFLGVTTFATDTYEHDHNGFDLPDGGPEQNQGPEQTPSHVVDPDQAGPAEEPHGLDFHAVFQIPTTSHGEGAIAHKTEALQNEQHDALSPRITSNVQLVSSQGVSSNGMSFSFTQTTVVGGGSLSNVLSTVQPPHTSPDDQPHARIEELPDDGEAQIGQDVASEQQHVAEEDPEEDDSGPDSDSA